MAVWRYHYKLCRDLVSRERKSRYRKITVTGTYIYIAVQLFYDHN